MGGPALDFDGFAVLNGGSDIDTFLINGLVSNDLNGNGGDDIFRFLGTPAATRLYGSIDGGAGLDALDYSAYAGDVNVDFANQTATAVSGTVINVENLVGSASPWHNTIYGDDGNNTITGSNATMVGRKGNDTYVILPGWGTDMIVELAGQGNDTVDFSHVSGNLHFVFTGTGITVTDGSGDTLTTDANVENFIGGSGGNLFSFHGSAQVSGTVNGGTGLHSTGTLDYSGYGSARNFVLTGYGSLHGYRGTETSLLGGFDNIDALVGTTKYTDSLAGMNMNAAWHINSLTDGQLRS